jgi:hypothetical protein
MSFPASALFKSIHLLIYSFTDTQHPVLNAVAATLVSAHAGNRNLSTDAKRN